MLKPTSKRSPSFYVSHAVVRLEALNAENRTISWASGFVINERDYLSLYTCWHVVSGADPHRLPSKPPTKRERLRVQVMTRTVKSPGIATIGGLTTFDVELYDESGNSVWSQGEPQPGTENAMMRPSHWDCVRLNVSSFADFLHSPFQPEDDIVTLRLDISEDAFIVGYPYGYSANETGPDPIFLRRTPASNWGPRYFSLLDGPGAPGMSGGPIVTRLNNEWRLVGIYNGVVFPEAKYCSSILEQNKNESRLPLGKYTVLTVARASLGVNPWIDSS